MRVRIRARTTLMATGLVATGLGLLAAPAAAEPAFLSRQYARCTNCHYSPTGGGLLTPYGRSLSREELSTFGRSGGASPSGREHEFLYGASGDALRPVSLGIDLRPAHLNVDAFGSTTTRTFLMNAELAAGLQHGGWTFYGSVSRQPVGDDSRVASFEHWISYQTARGLGVRAGRFLPAYGVKLADHTSYNRSLLDLQNDDQVYALELSFNGDRHLVQVSAGPGRADDIDDADARAFTATGRWQYDLTPRLALVGSGLFRNDSEIAAQSGATGLAVGVAPTSRLTVWTQADARFRQGASRTAYTLLADANFEAYRGVWLRFSPQLVTDFVEESDGIFRMVFGLNLLPRTHWNVVLNYYHDRDCTSDATVKTWLLQLHLYL